MRKSMTGGRQQTEIMLKKILMGMLDAPVRAMHNRRKRRFMQELQPALAQFEQKKYLEVIGACKSLIAEGRASESASHLCGRALLALGRSDEALGYLTAAVAAEPDFAEALSDLASAQAATGDLGAAEDSMRRAIALRPSDIDYRLDLIRMLEAAKKANDAVAELLVVLELAPNRFDLAFKAFGEVSDLGMFSEALNIAEQALLEFGESVDTLRMLASARYGCADMEGAVSACRKALAYGDRSELYVTLGSALFALGRVDDAVAGYQRALELAPDSPDAGFHLGLIDLMRGNYGKGWNGFDQRFRRARRKTARPCNPAWDGSSLTGRNLLVMREQGLGDEIMFASCYPQLIEYARYCVFECDPRLHKLFSRSFPGAAFHPLEDLNTTEQTDPGVLVDARVYAGSVPRHLRRSVQEFPAHQGYLKPDPDRVAEWGERLSKLGTGLKVGLSWRGGTVFTHRERRTLILPELLPVLLVPGVHWVNLQYGKRSEELAEIRRMSGIGIVDWPDAIDGDYDETAALVGALDLVVSVCTSVVHLSGALGRPVWVMTARVPEWRYGLEGTSMPWYPSARLFRQTEQGAWGPVIGDVAHSLRQYVDAVRLG